MKIVWNEGHTTPISERAITATVRGETEPLTDVVLCAPDYLAPVPCCSVTRERLSEGFKITTSIALDQHRAVQRALTEAGVTCHMLAAAPGMPDLCFTRDVAVTTPWGVVVLNPAKTHRRREAEHFARAAQAWTGSEVARVTQGVIEGGDIASRVLACS